jgi:Tfp pilus assembly PilM family ATPase
MNFKKKMQTMVGFDYDYTGIRAAKVSSYRNGQDHYQKIETLEKIEGDFEKESSLLDGLRKIKDLVLSGMSEKIVTHLAGKQVFTFQIPFKKLPGNELKTALLFEAKKNIPFDTKDIILDYQILDSNNNGEMQVLVSATSRDLIQKQLDLFAGIGMKPQEVKMLPVAMANSLKAVHNMAGPGGCAMVIHLGPGSSTIVIDGPKAPFYTRNIFFAAEDLFGRERKIGSENERTNRINSFCDEITHTISFYGKTYHHNEFGAVYLLGNYARENELTENTGRRLGLPVREANLQSCIDSNYTKPSDPCFGIALSLAIQEEGSPDHKPIHNQAEPDRVTLT